jgi:hypothetical protein
MKAQTESKLAAEEIDLLDLEDKVCEVRQLVAMAWLAVQGIASGGVNEDGNNGLQFLLANVQDDLSKIGKTIAKARGVSHEFADTRLAIKKDAARRKRNAV